ncbi:MAG: hypothetical protein LBS55_10320 [Prevotellaceae bacterium]|jgi:hypothetical protein|nr:hypothetical protein [Prevotellaceae bacterium]
MKKIIILVALLMTTNAWGQTPWQFKSKIDRGETGFLLEGAIDNKYPITMYLTRDNFCNTDNNNKWNYTFLLNGWYYYNNKKIKLPLIGYERYFRTNSTDGKKIVLYVPVNILDEINEKTNCELEKYKEIFIAEEENQEGLYSLQYMQWKPDGKNSFLPVNLKKIQSPSLKTKVTITLEVRGIEMFYFNLTDNLSDLKDAYQSYNTTIDNIEILASKAINNDFYLIFSFSRPSVPGSLGFGYCGAGYEDYLGFLHISSLEMKEFKYYQTDSCISFIKEKYMYDENFPEKGIQEYDYKSNY